MKKLMYISAETKEAASILKSESALLCSESHDGYICKEETYTVLDAKYHFKEVSEEDGERFCVWELCDLLECDWQDETINLNSDYGHMETLEHNISGDVELLLDYYQDESYSGYENNIDELFGSNDWYQYLLKEVKRLMLNLILDSIKMDVASQLRELSKED